LKTSITILLQPFPFPLAISLSRFHIKGEIETPTLGMIMIGKLLKKVIRDASNETLKVYKINMYKDLIKRKKIYDININQKKLLQLSKFYTRKF